MTFFLELICEMADLSIVLTVSPVCLQWETALPNRSVGGGRLLYVSCFLPRIGVRHVYTQYIHNYRLGLSYYQLSNTLVLRRHTKKKMAIKDTSKYFFLAQSIQTKRLYPKVGQICFVKNILSKEITSLLHIGCCRKLVFDSNDSFLSVTNRPSLCITNVQFHGYCKEYIDLFVH